MKQIIFTAILISAFCFAAFAQVNENPCQKINIRAPETVQPEETFKIFATLDKSKGFDTSTFNWTIIKGNEITKKNNAGIIEIDSKNLEGNEPIIILAEASNGKCQDVAVTKIYVVPPGGLPLTVAQYSKVDWNEEKARLDDVASEIQKSKDLEIFVIADLEKRTIQTDIKNYLVKILRYLSEIRGIERNRVTFVISEAKEKSTRLMLLQQDYNPDFCDNCFVFRGEDLEGIVNLFQPKQITKTAKK
jgi:hypothetical protein